MFYYYLLQTYLNKIVIQISERNKIINNQEIDLGIFFIILSVHGNKKITSIEAIAQMKDISNAI